LSKISVFLLEMWNSGRKIPSFFSLVLYRTQVQNCNYSSSLYYSHLNHTRTVSSVLHSSLVNIDSFFPFPKSLFEKRFAPLLKKGSTYTERGREQKLKIKMVKKKLYIYIYKYIIKKKALVAFFFHVQAIILNTIIII